MVSCRLARSQRWLDSMTLPPSIKEQILQHAQAEQPKSAVVWSASSKDVGVISLVATWLLRQMSIL